METLHESLAPLFIVWRYDLVAGRLQLVVQASQITSRTGYD
jgi:hypothetical protein